MLDNGARLKQALFLRHLQRVLYALLWCFPTALAPAAPAQIPGGRKHGLTGAGGGLQHRLDAGDHRDGGRGVSSLALGGHYDDHVAFGKILQRD
jgi:hypothetical protein